MAQSTTVEAVFRANVSQYVKSMEQATEATKELKKKTSTLDQLSSTFGKLGAGMTAGITTPLIGLATKAMEVGNEFEAQMSRVQAIAGATKSELEKLTNQAIDLGASTSFSASEVAEGMENMASAGFSVTEIMQAMTGVLDLAAVSGGDVGLSAEAVATTLRQFGLEASQAGHLADVFARAAADTNAETVDMADAMKYAGPVANTLGLSMEETAAAIGIMSDMGVKGSQAGTTLRSAFTRLANPTKEAREEMEALGVNVFDAEGNMRPLGDVIGDLQGAMGGMTSEQKAASTAIIFGQQAMSGMLGLIDAGPEKFNSLEDSLVNSGGAAEEMADIILDNVAGAVEEMGGAIETAAINIQQILAPAVKNIVEWITDLINKFNALTDEQQANILKWAGIAAAIGPALLAISGIFKVVSFAVKIFGILKTAMVATHAAFATGSTVMGAFKIGLTTLMGPAGWITAGILALIAAGIALWQNWDTVKEKAKQLGDWLSNVWDTIKTTAVQFFTDMANGFKESWERLKTNAKTAVENMKTAIIDGWNNIKQGAIDGMTAMVEGVQTGWNNFKQGVADMWNGVKTFFVDGWNNLKQSAIDGATALVESVKTWWKNLKQSASDTWTSIKDGAVAGWNGLVEGVTGLVSTFIQNIADRFSFLSEGLSMIWEGIKTMAGAGWELIKIAVITPVLALLQLIRGDFDGLKDSLSQIWEKIKMNAGLIWEGFKEIVSGIVTALVDTVTTTIEGWKNILSYVWTSIKNKAVEAWEATKQGAIDIWNAMKQAVVDAVEALKQGAIDGWNALKENVINLAKNAKEGAINAWNSLKQGTIDAFNAIKQGAIDIWNGLKNWLSNTWESIKGTATNKVTETKDSVKTGFNTAKTDATNAVTNLKDNVINGFKTLVSNITTWMKEVPIRVKNGFRDAVNAAKNFVSDAIQVGKDIIGGFISGITQKAKDLISSVTGVIDSAIGGAKKLLGIKSPSRVFAYFGKMTDEGFGKGIRQHEDKALKPMENMMDRVKGAFDPDIFDFNNGMASLNARTNARVDHVVSDNIQKNQAQVIYLNMGGKTYRAYVDGITRRQERDVDLEEVYLA